MSGPHYVPHASWPLPLCFASSIMNVFAWSLRSSGTIRIWHPQNLWECWPPAPLICISSNISLLFIHEARHSFTPLPHQCGHHLWMVPYPPVCLTQMFSSLPFFNVTWIHSPRHFKFKFGFHNSCSHACVTVNDVEQRCIRQHDQENRTQRMRRRD